MAVHNGTPINSTITLLSLNYATKSRVVLVTVLNKLLFLYVFYVNYSLFPSYSSERVSIAGSGFED